MDDKKESKIALDEIMNEHSHNYIAVHGKKGQVIIIKPMNYRSGAGSVDKMEKDKISMDKLPKAIHDAVKWYNESRSRTYADGGEITSYLDDNYKSIIVNEVSNMNKISYDQYDEMVDSVRTKFNVDSDEANVLVDSYLDEYAVQVYRGGGDTKDEVYIEYLNKDKNFQKDRKSFKSYDDAVAWARENFEKFNPDMINYFKNGGDVWIQDAVKEMEKKGTVGVFTKQAEKHGMKPVEFAKEVLGNPDNYTEKTRERAQFVNNVNPEKFSDGGDSSTFYGYQIEVMSILESRFNFKGNQYEDVMSQNDSQMYLNWQDGISAEITADDIAPKGE